MSMGYSEQANPRAAAKAGFAPASAKDLQDVCCRAAVIVSNMHGIGDSILEREILEGAASRCKVRYERGGEEF